MNQDLPAKPLTHVRRVVLCCIALMLMPLAIPRGAAADTHTLLGRGLGAFAILVFGRWRQRRRRCPRY